MRGHSTFRKWVLIVAAVVVATALYQPSTRAGDSPEAPDAPDMDRPGSAAYHVRSAPARNCTRCHRMDQTFSHPVEVQPSMTVPDDLPLRAGRITCNTCHDVTAQPGHGGRAVDSGLSLQGDRTVVELCQACHSTGPLDRTSAHAMGMLRAHAGSEASHRGSSRSTVDTLGQFDAGTATCLGCHDGSITGRTGHVAATAMMNIGLSHPVGVEYRPDRGGRLRSKHALDDRIRLFDDRVGCGSCHSVYSPQPSLLVMSNQDSALCLSCHRP